MSKILTTDKLVASLKRRAMLPTSQSTFTTQDFIDILNEEMGIEIIPYLMSTHEEYLVKQVDLDFTDSNNLVRTFTIPERAIGNKLRGAAHVTGEELIQDTTRIEIDDLSYFQNVFSSNYNSNFTYYVQGDELRIVSSEPVATKLRLWFYMKPSELVQDKFGAVITGINTTTGEVTVSNVPDGFVSGSLVDFTSAKNPSTLLDYDKTAATINSTTKILTFDVADLPDRLAVGDYITLAGQTIVPQVPDELHPLLAQIAAVHCLGAIGDESGEARAQKRFDKMQRNVIDLLDNRVENTNQKINNLNSPIRQTKRRNFRGGW